MIGDRQATGTVRVLDSLADSFGIPGVNDLFTCYRPVVRVLPDAGLHFDLISHFRVIMWSEGDAADSAVSPDTVNTLWTAWAGGIPLYFIGERLAEAGGNLDPAVRTRWETMTGLAQASGESGPGDVIPHDQELRVNELFASNICEQQEKLPVTSFFYPRSIPACRRLVGGEVRATLNDEPVLIRHPGFEETEDPFLGSRLVQRFRLVSDDEGADAHAIEQQSNLLQNGILWLLGARCENFAASLICDAAEELRPCAPARLTASVGNNGACAAGGVVVVQHLPAGVQAIEAALEWDDPRLATGEVRMEGQRVVFGIGQVPSGATATLHTWVAGVRRGDYVTTYVRKVRFKDDSQCEVPVSVPAEPCEWPRLAIRNTPDALELVLRGTWSGGTDVEQSDDLTDWQVVREHPPHPDGTTLWTVPTGQPEALFYRLRIRR